MEFFPSLSVEPNKPAYAPRSSGQMLQSSDRTTIRLPYLSGDTYGVYINPDVFSQKHVFFLIGLLCYVLSLLDSTKLLLISLIAPPHPSFMESSVFQ